MEIAADTVVLQSCWNKLELAKFDWCTRLKWYVDVFRKIVCKCDGFSAQLEAFHGDRREGGMKRRKSTHYASVASGVMIFE